MDETPVDLEELQKLLDRSAERAGSHLRSIFTLESRLSALELIERLPGIFEMHLATTTREGAPLVAPVDGLLVGGRIWFGLPKASFRTRRLRYDPRVSASFARDDGFAFIVHGVARETRDSEPMFERYARHLDAVYVRRYGPGWREWQARQRDEHGDGYTAWIDPHRIYAKG